MTPMAIAAFCRLSSAASRHIDASHAGRAEPGSPAAVALAELRTDLDDARIAHTLARWPEVHPDELTPLGLIPADVAERIRSERASSSD